MVLEGTRAFRIHSGQFRIHARQFRIHVLCMFFLCISSVKAEYIITIGQSFGDPLIFGADLVSETLTFGVDSCFFLIGAATSQLTGADRFGGKDEG